MSSVKFYYPVGENITFDCDPGLVLRGARMLRCLRTGKWSSAIPTCVPPSNGGRSGGGGTTTGGNGGGGGSASAAFVIGAEDAADSELDDNE